MDAQTINTLRVKVARLERSKPGTMKLAAAYNALGDEFYDQEDWDQAQLNYEKALHIYQHKARKSMKMAFTCYILACVLIRQHEFFEACTFHRAAVKIYERKIPMSIDLAEAYFKMGFILFIQEQFDEACQYCQKALDIYQHKRPEQLPVIMCFMYAKMLRLQNDMNMAQQVYEQTLEIQQKNESEPYITANISIRLAILLHDMGQMDQARRHFEKALAIVISQEPDVAGLYSNLAEYMYKQGNTHQEQHYYQKAIAIIDDKWEGIEYEVAQDRVGLGLSLYDNGERAKACLQFEQVINLYEGGCLQDKRPLFATLGSFFAANAYVGIGRVLDEDGEYTQSLLYYQKALVIYNRLGPKRIENIPFYDRRPWPTINMVEQRIAMHPIHLLTIEHALLSFTWCHVFAKCGNDVQSIYYMLREQLYLVEVCNDTATRSRRIV